MGELEDFGGVLVGETGEDSGGRCAKHCKEGQEDT